MDLTLEDLDFETGLLEIRLHILQKGAGDDRGALALEVLHLMSGALPEVQVSRIGETSRGNPLADAGEQVACLPHGMVSRSWRTGVPHGSYRRVVRRTATAVLPLAKMLLTNTFYTRYKLLKTYSGMVIAFAS